MHNRKVDTPTILPRTVTNIYQLVMTQDSRTLTPLANIVNLAFVSTILNSGPPSLGTFQPQTKSSLVLMGQDTTFD